MKKIIIMTITIALGATILFWKLPSKNNNQPKGQTQTPKQLTNVTIAPDWTPNTNHTGIYVAINKGWYTEEGLDVEILPSSSHVSPSMLVNTGKADIGISATESILSNAAIGSPVVSIAGILAHNTSAMIALKDSGINSPKDFTGKTYGGWGANYETPIITTMIEHDGGEPEFKTVILEGDPVKAIETGIIDFAWIFPAWQVIEAKQRGVEMNVFPLSDYGIPDYYTPNFITSNDTATNNPDMLKKFLRATARGYEYARDNVKESAEILIASVPEETFPNTQLVYDSQKYLSPHYVVEGGQWGWQTEEMWHGYPQFMIDNDSVVDAEGNVVDDIDFSMLYTNEFLP